MKTWSYSREKRTFVTYARLPSSFPFSRRRRKVTTVPRRKTCLNANQDMHKVSQIEQNTNLGCFYHSILHCLHFSLSEASQTIINKYGC